MRIVRTVFPLIVSVILSVFSAREAKAQQGVTVTLDQPASNTTYAIPATGDITNAQGTATGSNVVPVTGAVVPVYSRIRNTRTNISQNTAIGTITLYPNVTVTINKPIPIAAVPYDNNNSDTYEVKISVDGATFAGQSPVHDNIKFTK